MADETERLAQFNAAAYEYERDGFASSPGPLLDAQTVTAIREHAERIFLSQYESGRSPRSNTGGPDVSKHPPYIEASFPQDSDFTLAWAIRDPRLAAWAAKATGAKKLTVWNALVMKKYPTKTAKTVVGWHQDQKYLDRILKGTTVNLWIALDEVSRDTGPVRFVPGSHRWGRKYSTGFFEHDADKQRSEIDVPPGFEWQEVETPLPAGWATVHSQMTVHGSGMCQGGRPRLSMLMSLAIDDFEMVPGSDFAARIADRNGCPVVYGA
jgi:hypothetical protein